MTVKKIPDALRDQLSDAQDPAELGGPNAEPTGVWRVLRNSLLLGAAALALVGVVYVA